MMMNKLRENTHIILWILIIGFLATIVFSWGMDFTGFRAKYEKGIIGVVNGRDIMYENYMNAVRQQFAMFRDRIGQEPDYQQIRMIRDQVWENFVNSLLTTQEIDRRGITISDEEIIFSIRNNPPAYVAQNEMFLTEGRFDPAKYQAALNNPEIDWRGVEMQVRNELPMKKLQNMLLLSVRVTSDEVKTEYMKNELSATAKYLLISPDRFPASTEGIPDENVQKYYNDHNEEFKENAKRKIRYVMFDTETTNDDSLEIQDSINECLKRAKEGDDFTQLALEYSMSPAVDQNRGDLGFFPEGTMDEKFTEAAFAAKEGEVVGPVETSFGIHIIKVDSVRKTRSKVDSVSARHILFKYEPSQSTIDNVEYSANLFLSTAQEDGFSETASEQKLEPRETPFFEKGRFIPGVGVLNELSFFAFSKEIGALSPALKTIQGYLVAEIIDATEEHIKPFEEVKNNILRILDIERRMENANDYANEVYRRINQGRSLEQAGANDSLTVELAEDFSASSYITNVGRDLAFTAAAFSLDSLAVSKPVKGTKGYYIIQLLKKDAFNQEEFQISYESIYNTLLSTKRQEAYSQWLETLRRNADIEDFRNIFFGE